MNEAEKLYEFLLQVRSNSMPAASLRAWAARMPERLTPASPAARKVLALAGEVARSGDYPLAVLDAWLPRAEWLHCLAGFGEEYTLIESEEDFPVILHDGVLERLEYSEETWSCRLELPNVGVELLALWVTELTLRPQPGSPWLDDGFVSFGQGSTTLKLEPLGTITARALGWRPVPHQSVGL